MAGSGSTVAGHACTPATPHRPRVYIPRRDTRTAVDGRVRAVTEETAVARPGVGALLRDLDHAPPSELVDVCAGWLTRHVAAQACVLLLADYAEATLEPVKGGPAAAHIR